MHTVTHTVQAGVSISPSSSIRGSTSRSTSASSSTSTPGVARAATSPGTCNANHFWCTHPLLIIILFVFAIISAIGVGAILHMTFLKYYKYRPKKPKKPKTKKQGKSFGQSFSGSDNSYPMGGYNESALESGMPGASGNFGGGGYDGMEGQFDYQGGATPGLDGGFDDGVGYSAPRGMDAYP